MKYTVIIDKRAQKEIKKLSPKIRLQIADKLKLLEQNPRTYGASKLTNKDNLYRIRSGQFRIIYQIQDKKCIVLVIAIGDRKDVYQKLKLI
jgi:mRNA interferase RelE/StbE